MISVQVVAARLPVEVEGVDEFQELIHFVDRVVHLILSGKGFLLIPVRRKDGDQRGHRCPEIPAVSES